jgi:7,8-dihydropterin-6-yl-methyl-4-(beta-D-ribofuranosyl)aminobenzene 5'-phosphate synthase
MWRCIGTAVVVLAAAGLDPPVAAAAAASDRVIEIVTVIDNSAVTTSLDTRWGLSIAIISPKESTLFDTGPDGGVLVSNMRHLGLKPGQFGIVVVSHDHRDHTGGLPGFLAANPNADVLLPGKATSAASHVRAAGGNARHVGQSMEVAASIRTTGPIGAGIQEQALIVDTAEGLVVITGCAHPGIVAVLEAVQILNPDRPIALVMGGFHLQNASPGQIAAIVETFRRMEVRKVAPSHCTGEAARKQFQPIYGPDYIEGGAGLVLRFPVQN